MARLGPIRDLATAALYGRALMAVVRADGEFGLEEGLRLHDRLTRRIGPRVAVDELMLAAALEPAALAAALDHGPGPFRDPGVHPRTLASMLVADGLAVVLAKGHITERQAMTLIAFATALGCAPDDVARLGPALRPWLSA
ncbi:MAG: hypothetical protein IPL61_01605 [Myxococcales bacterium]|nr:hypothetical protein [Myxococcales bacterium]